MSRGGTNATSAAKAHVGTTSDSRTDATARDLGATHLAALFGLGGRSGSVVFRNLRQLRDHDRDHSSGDEQHEPEQEQALPQICAALLARQIGKHALRLAQ